MGRQGAQVIVIDGLQAGILQALDLLTIMNDIPQAIQRAVVELAFCCLDGSRDTKAETGVVVDSDRHKKLRIKN